ncbi:MAG: patatin-like phospholipase family protein [Deltaproteobacteria bacterium]|nr:patatin-like phospholipase family protein [Deltaproteobacteria bacterium]
MHKKHLVILGIVLLVTGCAHYQDNSHFDNYVDKSGYRFENVPAGDNTDNLSVILVFSGGGTRAAALSYGVLEKLRSAPITCEGKEKKLVDEVDVISSVSGGSFTSAYYALFGDKIFTDFKSDFLYRDVQGDLFKRLFNPYNWFRLMSFTFDRIDLAAEYYDENIFKHNTFSDLLKRGKRPYIILNASDMTLGDRFEFTQKQFDPICSDLSDYPIARAVAASSAFPGLLSPITITNYAGTCNNKEPFWVANALLDRDVTKRDFLDATHFKSYQDNKNRPYIHLLDGGISDNIGLRGPLQALVTNHGPWGLLNMINLGKVKKVVFIVVNAKNEPDTTLDRKESPPDLTRVLSTVVNAPMDNYSFDTIEQLRSTIMEWKKDDLAYAKCVGIINDKCPGASLPPPPAPVDFYPVVISFDSLTDAGERTFFKNLPTSFTLPAADVDRLIEVGGRLLNESEEYKRLLRDLHS